ncbi:MAG: hypothetical protein Q9P44_00480 [Anaerolineae bacterium]|nr:hypothetical protein [Anaerolineae bacterium]
MTETIACKHCGAAISAESIADGELAICNICDALDNLSTEPIALPEKVKAKRHSLALNKFHIKQHPDAVEITYRWWGKQHRNFLPFLVGWTIFLHIFVVIAIVSQTFFMLMFLAIHIIVGISIGYYVLSGFLNRTQILIRKKGLEITHRPLPKWNDPDKMIDRRAIEQVYCKQRLEYTSNGVLLFVFDVHYIEKGAQDVVLVKGLATHEEALFIEQQIEKLYGIKDEAVADEAYKGQASSDSNILSHQDSRHQKRKQH